MSPHAKAPPLARGSTHFQGVRACLPAGSPARAGIDPLDPQSSHAPTRLPRSRGDRPIEIRRPGIRLLAPPLARGSTRHRRVQVYKVAGSPARAGIDPQCFECVSCCCWLPRSRGDRPVGPVGRQADRTAPPLARGSTLHPDGRWHGREGSPARAGIDPARGQRDRWDYGLPRSRGDRPHSQPGCNTQGAAPPLARGSTRNSHVIRKPADGSPARAGIDPGPFARLLRLARLPRSRGDRPGKSPATAPPAEAPPLARGSTQGGLPSRRRSSGSPARAGIDPEVSSFNAPMARLPRSRGDRPCTSYASGRVFWAPPLARGSTPQPVESRYRRVGSPARAGIDPPASRG